MNAIHLAEELECELRAVGDEERAIGAKAYLKSNLEFIGVAAKPLRVVAREFLERHPGIDHPQLTELVRSLWQQPVFEMRAVAVALLERRIRSLETADLDLVEELLRRSHLARGFQIPAGSAARRAAASFQLSLNAGIASVFANS